MVGQGPLVSGAPRGEGQGGDRCSWGLRSVPSPPSWPDVRSVLSRPAAVMPSASHPFQTLLTRAWRPLPLNAIHVRGLGLPNGHQEPRAGLSLPQGACSSILMPGHPSAVYSVHLLSVSSVPVPPAWATLWWGHPARPSTPAPHVGTPALSPPVRWPRGWVVEEGQGQGHLSATGLWMIHVSTTVCRALHRRCRPWTRGW